MAADNRDGSLWCVQRACRIPGIAATSADPAAL